MAAPAGRAVQVRAEQRRGLPVGEGKPELLFTENESNASRLWGAQPVAIRERRIS